MPPVIHDLVGASVRPQMDEVVAGPRPKPIRPAQVNWLDAIAPSEVQYPVVQAVTVTWARRTQSTACLASSRDPNRCQVIQRSLVLILAVMPEVRVLIKEFNDA